MGPTLPAPYPMVDPAIYGSGKGIVEVAAWNLDGSPPAGGLPAWLVVLSAAIPVTLVAGLILKETKMAAKKKRGLGGTPAEHSAFAEGQLADAEAKYEKAYQFASSDCRKALKNQSEGDFAYGKAVANYAFIRKSEPELHHRVEAIGDMAEKNQGRIAKMCLAKKSLSAAPRRRKARR